jgi:DNA recombination protein RmuC
MDIVISVLLVIVVILMVFLLRKKEVMADIDTPIKTLEEAFKNELKTNREEINTIAKENRKELNDSIQVLEKSLTETVDKKFNQQQEKQKQLNQESSTIIKEKFSDFNQQQAQFNQQATDNIKHIEKTVGTQLTNIREESSKKLEQMRQTVDEKLQSTLERRLGESFKQVSERLEQVHIGLGEMKSVANDVGDLKKVLSNVKTRGTLGEYQLGAILEQMLSPEQYACNVATKKGSQANVEFAVKLPGKSEGEVWIPIDAKYPREDYERLINAYELGDKIKIEEFQKKVLKSIELFAKEIASKYIDPPHTTDFAVMYLPDEGLYAEVLRHVSLFEKLQRQYKITVTGPTTLSAFLNSLQMGFTTLAIQKRFYRPIHKH